MKYLKSFNKVNELNINSDEFRKIVIDVRDILLELQDGGRIDTSIKTTDGKYKTYILFSLLDFNNYDGFYFDEISEYVFRIKDYLGEDLKSCSVLLVRDKNRYGVGGNRIEMNLENENIITKKLKNIPIENLIIQIK